jgi:hypothetical protein
MPPKRQRRSENRSRRTRRHRTTLRPRPRSPIRKRPRKCHTTTRPVFSSSRGIVSGGLRLPLRQWRMAMAPGLCHQHHLSTSTSTSRTNTSSLALTEAKRRLLRPHLIDMLPARAHMLRMILDKLICLDTGPMRPTILAMAVWRVTVPPRRMSRGIPMHHATGRMLRSTIAIQPNRQSFLDTALMLLSRIEWST